MTNTDGERFAIYSSMGVPLKEVGTFIQVRNLIESAPDKVFDSKVSTDLARIEGVHTRFVYEFSKDTQPQDIRKAWNKYNNYPGF